MPVFLNVQYTDLERCLDKLEYKLANPQELLDSIGTSLLQENQARHAQEVDPNGKKWQPLKPKTLAKKTKSQMLYETGYLLNFFRRSQPNSVFIGTSDWKATFFQNGTTRMVARPIAGFSQSDEQLTVHLTQDYLQAIFNN